VFTELIEVKTKFSFFFFFFLREDGKYYVYTAYLYRVVAIAHVYQVAHMSVRC